MEIDNANLTHEEESFDWTGTYTWRVENWTQLREEKMCSPEFEIGGYSWRLMVFPSGNNSQRPSEYVALYLDFLEASFTPPQMCPTAKFQLIAEKTNCPEESMKREATHTFTAQASDWGFTQFLSLQELQNSENVFLVDDTLTFHLNIFIQKNENLDAVLQRDKTFVGLKKQEDGGYINCLLQCLFHIGSFRKAVYQAPSLGHESLENSVLGAVQSLFYQLQYKNSFADVSKLREVMRWGPSDVVFYHDFQNLHNTLFGKLDGCTSDQEAQSVTSMLFKGCMSQYLECLSVQYSLTCKEDYTQIKLDVLGCKDIYESLEKFCSFERLGGTNKGNTPLHGLINTKQGLLFERFPSVLQFHLKRSFFDSDRNVMLKINSYHEFYDVLDLDYNGRALLSKNVEKNIENKYKLHSVIAHKGGFNGGHYFAFIRPNETWYKFDDEDVEEASAEEAINKQFGDKDEAIIETFSQDEGEATYSTACTLVYIRQSEWERIMCEVGKEDIPKVISQRLETTIIDEGSRKKREAHLYVIIKLACEKHFSEQLGNNYYFDLVNFDGVKNYRIHKKTLFEDFKEMVCKDFEIPKHLQRFWLWNVRTNHTMRVSKPLIKGEQDLNTVLDLRNCIDKSSPLDQEKTALITIKLFLESPEEASLREGNLRPIQRSEILIFLKYYDPESTRLTYLGHMFIKKTYQFYAIFEKAKKTAGLAPEDKVIGFEEVKYLPEVICIELAPDSTPEKSHLIQGDIIIIQKVTADNKCEFLTVKSFFKFIQDSTKVNFKLLKNPKEEGFKLDLLKTMTYEQVTNELAKHLELDDPKKLRLTQHNIYACNPHRNPIEYNGIESLEKMILHGRQYTNIIYYEILDMQLPHLETLKCLTIQFHNAKGEWQSEHQLRLPKDYKVSDLVKALKAELGEEYNDCDMRIMETLSSKVFKILDADSVLEELYEKYWIFRAEVIPEDQKNLKSDEYLVLFCHCKADDNCVEVFRDPVWVKVKTGETVREVKTRVQKTLEISNEEFSDWMFAYHARPMHPVEYLEDEDEILAKFSRFVFNGKTNREFVGDDVSFIAMVHEDK